MMSEASSSDKSAGRSRSAGRVRGLSKCSMLVMLKGPQATAELAVEAQSWSRMPDFNPNVAKSLRIGWSTKSGYVAGETGGADRDKFGWGARAEARGGGQGEENC